MKTFKDTLNESEGSKFLYNIKLDLADFWKKHSNKDLKDVRSEIEDDFVGILDLSLIHI